MYYIYHCIKSDLRFIFKISKTQHIFSLNFIIICRGCITLLKCHYSFFRTRSIFIMRMKRTHQTWCMDSELKKTYGVIAIHSWLIYWFENSSKKGANRQLIVPIHTILGKKVYKLVKIPTDNGLRNKICCTGNNIVIFFLQ